MPQLVQNKVNCGPCHHHCSESLRGGGLIFLCTVNMKFKCTCGKYVDILLVTLVEKSEFIECTVAMIYLISSVDTVGI